MFDHWRHGGGFLSLFIKEVYKVLVIDLLFIVLLNFCMLEFFSTLPLFHFLRSPKLRDWQLKFWFGSKIDMFVAGSIVWAVVLVGHDLQTELLWKLSVLTGDLLLFLSGFVQQGKPYLRELETNFLSDELDHLLPSGRLRLILPP